MGDAVLALPAVGELVSSGGDGEALVLASTTSAEVFSRLPGAAVRVIGRPGGTWGDSLAAIRRGAAALRRHRPSAVFSLTRSFTSAAMCLAGGVPARVGFTDAAWGWSYTSRVGRGSPRESHLCGAYCDLVESAGMRVGNRIPRIAASRSDLDAGERLLDCHRLRPRSYICIFPGARYGPSKRWPAERFGLLGHAVVANLGLNVVLLGGQEDRDACRAVAGAAEGGALDLGGRCDFRQLVGVLALSAGVVANDSGGMHLAAALGAPVVGLFFSTDPRWTGPLGPGSVALRATADCSPCFRRSCERGEQCTETIEVGEVLSALAGLAGRTG